VAIALAQDVFVAAYLGRERFGGEWTDDRAVGGWLRGIAANLLHGERRRRRRAARAVVDHELPDPAAPDPGAAAERAESDARLRAHLEDLRGPWRTVLYMHYIEGSGLREIGALLGITERAVEGRLRRAREELRKSLARTEEAQR